MRVRILFAAIMTFLLVAGTVASAACEMTCLPQTQTSACCPHHAQHSMEHCKHPGAVTLTDVHHCDHPQDNTTVVAAVDNATTSLIFENVAVCVSPVHIELAVFSHLDSSSGSLLKPSSNPPLRI